MKIYLNSKITNSVRLGLLIFLILGYGGTYSQDISAKNRKLKHFNLKIYDFNGEVFKGRLKFISDSSITIIIHRTTAGLLITKKISFKEIESIHVRSSNAIQGGAAVGALLGLLGGAISSGVDPPEDGFFTKEFQTTSRILFGSVIGCGIGVCIGATSRAKYAVFGQYTNFAIFEGEMIKKGFMQNPLGATY